MGAIANHLSGRGRGFLKWIILATVIVVAMIVSSHNQTVREVYRTYAPALPSGTKHTEPSQSHAPKANKTESRMLSLAEVLAKQPPPPKNFDPLVDAFDVSPSIRFDPAGPRPEQFVLLTASEGLRGGNSGHHEDIKNMLERALWNRQDYCDHWGYICHWVNTSRFDVSPFGPHWKKLPALVETFQTYPDAQWIWILDEDAIIMSPEVDQRRLVTHEGLLERIMRNETIRRTSHFTEDVVIPEDIDVIIGQEANMLNSGSILFRRSESGRWIINLWGAESIKVRSMQSDQLGLMRVMNDSSVARSHLGIVPFRMVQSWAIGSEIRGWFPGDLVVHFAGCWVRNECKKVWEKYWALKGKALERTMEEWEEKGDDWWWWMPTWGADGEEYDESDGAADGPGGERASG